MKYHALFVIFEKVAKFEIVVCCELKVVLYGLNVRFLGRMLEMILTFNLKCASNFLFVCVVLHSIPLLCVLNKNAI